MIHFSLRCLMAICCLCAFTSCRNSLVTAQTEYITRRRLASYHVGTPDPVINVPVFGQRLILHWSLPERFNAYQDLRLEVTMRFRNRTEHTFHVPICDLVNTYIYTLDKTSFCANGGIVTYKVDLVSSECILYKWRHQLWVDIIQLNPDNS